MIIEKEKQRKFENERLRKIETEKIEKEKQRKEKERQEMIERYKFSDNKFPKTELNKQSNININSIEKNYQKKSEIIDKKERNKLIDEKSKSLEKISFNKYRNNETDIKIEKNINNKLITSKSYKNKEEIETLKSKLGTQKDELSKEKKNLKAHIGEEMFKRYMQGFKDNEEHKNTQFFFKKLHF